MAKTTSAAVAERPTEALWLAPLPSPRIAPAPNRRSAPAQAAPAEGVLRGMAPITDLAVSRDGRSLIAAHYGDDTVSIVDTTDLTVQAWVQVAEPYAVAVADRAYVTSAGLCEDGIVAVDLGGGLPLAAKDIDAVVRGLAAAPAGDLLYVARCTETGADIAAVSVGSGKMTTIPLAGRPGVTADVLRISADGTLLYVALTDGAQSAVAVIDVQARQVVRSIALPVSVSDIAVHPDRRRVMVAGWDDELGGSVTVIDTAAGRVVETIAIGGLPTQVLIAGERAYVLNGDGIIILDVTASRIVRTVPAGRPVSCMAINPEGTRLYVAGFDGTVEARRIGPETRLRAAS